MELRLLLDDDEPEPHPLLVASQKVTAAELVAVAAVKGWLPDRPYLTPVVSASALDRA